MSSNKQEKCPDKFETDEKRLNEIINNSNEISQTAWFFKFAEKYMLSFSINIFANDIF